MKTEQTKSKKTYSKEGKLKQTNPPSQDLRPTEPNEFIKSARAKQLAEIFSAKAQPYTGDIVLPSDIIITLCRELRKVRANISELTQLDERPYAILPHDLATRSHWFMRRFKTSGGWQNI